MFEIKVLTDLPSAKRLWTCVCKAQASAKTRTLEQKNVESGAFLVLCKAALRLCEKYGLEKSSIEVYEDGGAVANAYRNRAETTALSFDGKTLNVLRTSARHVAGGDYGVRYCRIRVPATNPVRNQLKADGWIDGRDPYARITTKMVNKLGLHPETLVSDTAR